MIKGAKAARVMKRPKAMKVKQGAQAMKGNKFLRVSTHEDPCLWYVAGREVMGLLCFWHQTRIHTVRFSAHNLRRFEAYISGTWRRAGGRAGVILI